MKMGFLLSALKELQNGVILEVPEFSITPKP